MVLEKGDSLQSGKYQVIRQLGGGGFGLTYLAEDSVLRRQVVIKTPNRVFQRDQEYEKFIRRFQQEGQMLAKISHPSVVRVIEFFQEQGMPCLVMDYVEGETLNERVRGRGQILQDEAVQCFRQLATALQLVHQAGLIHCDVHPGNIILRQAREPVLIDFGSTKSLQPNARTVTTTVNDFAPYEQGQGGTPQPTLDVYGLSATLYFAVTGQKPVSAMNRKLYGDTLKPPKQHQAELSEWLNQVILKGMALEAPDRPPSMPALMGLMHPPLPSKHLSLGSQDKISERKPSFPKPQLAFPWVSLGLLALGYLPTGIFWGYSYSWLGTWAGTWAWAGAGVGTWASTRAGVGVWWAGALTLARIWVSLGVLVLVWNLVRTRAGVGAGIWAGAGTLIGTWTGAGVGANGSKVMMFILTLVGALLGSAISGYFTSISVWGGLGFGLLGFLQGWATDFTVMTSEVSEVSIDKRYHPSSVLVILGIVSTLGLAVGGGLGWWFKLSGVKLPI